MSGPIPKEPWKLLIAIGFAMGGGFASFLGLALTHDRVPREAASLPDFVLDNVIYQQRAIVWCERILAASSVMGGIVVLFHKHRWIVLRRVLFHFGIHYYYRAVFMAVTVLPGVDKQYELSTCQPSVGGSNVTLSIILDRLWTMINGGQLGLTINGKITLCGDWIYSGHTATLIIGYLVTKTYSPRKWYLLHYIHFCLSFMGVLFILLSRGHYTIDILLAYYFSTRIWYTYHTMADGGEQFTTRGNRRNYFRKVIWWPLFRFLELNVPGPLPNQFDLPIPDCFPIEAYGPIDKINRFVQSWGNDRSNQD